MEAYVKPGAIGQPMELLLVTTILPKLYPYNNQRNTTICAVNISKAHGNENNCDLSIIIFAALFKDVPAIEKQIMSNIPVEVGFEMYADFEHYSSGIYRHTAGEYLSGNAVKMLDWGTENSTDCWISANSWNSVWGESASLL
ncbi:unnamed protein product [Angiostrongylus costaricensis]|uniref:Pept_C1 domain-containing protein n=1 Tax=Angiostrongylus costaricensis TaxID=334426 RepID=A0A0R3PA89_ANGCS|nr:unnamed protein product [Angiostrongylus costaricensis]